ncbi:P2Y purinoceptor 1 [Amia ocellicauda]|uniref:P2Y purinoceptor 1 n=1 Tax=Amia ocellicauda TaxID=2972642 RepID=UPI0034648253
MINNTTSCTINKSFTRTFLPCVYVVVFFIGVFANCWGLRHVCLNWNKLGNINIFVMNLGIADLLYVFMLPFLVAYYAGGGVWDFGETFCKITRFSFNLNLYGSIGFLTCISVYRYLGIVHTMKVMGRITKWHSGAISLLVWILVIIQILPDMYYEKSSNSSQSCFDTTSQRLIEDYMSYSIGWTITGFGIPLVIILGCYGHVTVVLITNNNVASLLKQRCLKLVVILTVLFAVCFIPYHILRNLNMKTRISQKRGICYKEFNQIYISYQVSRGLACMNSAINPLIYLVSNDNMVMRLHEISKRARQSIVHLRNVIQYRRPLDGRESSRTNSKELI